ncbi:MAG: DMT family transporter [Reyranellaceae bacterium]
MAFDLSGNSRGIASMIASMMLFISNDALVKHVSESLPTTQIIFLRGLSATLLIATMAVALGAWRQMPKVVDRRVLARASIDSLGTFLYLLALFNMPIANVTAINLSVPLMLTVAAAFLLREQVGWRRWSAVTAGFIGVLLVVQPTATGFNWFALVALVATGTHAMRDLMTRRIGVGIPSIIVTLSTAIVVTICAGLAAAVETWRPLETRQVLLLIAASAFLSGGYYLVIDCMRHGELSVVAPFRYTAMLWALLLGYFVWGDVPNLLAWAGIVLLVGSGLYVLHRERIRRRQAALSS